MSTGVHSALKTALGYYGDDNRRDICLLDDTIDAHRRYRIAASGVALSVDNWQLSHLSNPSRISFATEREQLRTSPTAPGFALQRRIAGGCATAFLVTSTHVVTAGHWVRSVAATDLVFVFGFAADCDWPNEDLSVTPPYVFEYSHVAYGLSLVYCAKSDSRGDIAVVELTEPVDARVATPMTLAPRNTVYADQEIGMLGFPRGLPCKAVVGDDKPKSWPQVSSCDDRTIISNMDAFRNNSGSPVLDLEGHVIGVANGDSFLGDVDGCFTVAAPNAPGYHRSTRIDFISDVLKDIGVSI